MENNTIESRSTTTMQEGVFQKSRVPPLKGSKSDYATTSCGRPNAVGFAGDDKDYYLKPGVLNEAFVEDLLKLSGDEMIKKYKLKTWDESKQEREASVGATPPGSGP
ncbi:MAG: hypothetical protein M1820_000329 [Bogoriella megaspora]|nr:MAG: hypothetical protein M1820_000329 [Bogoriella megaspora]